MKRIVRLQIQYEIEVKDTLGSELMSDGELIQAITIDFETPVKTKMLIGKGKVEKIRVGWE